MGAAFDNANQLSMTDLSATALFGLALLAAVGMGEALRSKAGWPAEASRQVVHAMTGVLVVACPFLFERPGGIYVLAGGFVLVNLWAAPRRAFPGMHGIRRRSWGTVTFPLALVFALATCWTLDPGRVYVLQAAFLVLAVSDPLASVVGMRAERLRRFRVGTNEKSVAGSLAFFLSAWALTAGALTVLGGPPLTLVGVGAAAFVAAALATGAEALAEDGRVVGGLVGMIGGLGGFVLPIAFGVLSDQLTVPDGERRYLGENIFSFGEVEVPAPELTIKATGQQWYWDYEYMDAGLAFSQNLLPDDERLALKPAQPRLLAVDYELVVPVDTTVRLLVTADPSGVIHAFAVPSFGITIDAVPGKLNETWFNARKTGIYYGQCRELCGKDHAFMPIAVRVVEKDEFAFWMETYQQGFIDDANDTLPRVQ